MVREETYQEFLLKYAAIEDKMREVLVKIVEAQKTLVVCILYRFTTHTYSSEFIF